MPADRLVVQDGTAAPPAAPPVAPAVVEHPLLGRTTWIVLIAFTALLGVAFVLTLAIHRFVVEIEDVKLIFDVGQEHNVPTWWNSALLLAVAGVLLLAARLHDGHRLPTRRSLLIAALAVIYLSVDEAASFHEELGEPTQSWLDRRGLDVPTYAWVLPGAVIALTGVVVFLRWSRTLPRPVRSGCLLGLAMYFGGALGAESFNGWLREHDAEYPFVAGTLLEEWLEMGGCIVALHAVSWLLAVDGAHRVSWATSARWAGRPTTPVPTA